MPRSDQVLIVEDNVDVLYLATRRIRKAGYEVIAAEDGVQAIHRMVDNPYCRRMVTDYLMPTLGGTYWIRFLERFCADWTIVIVSSQDIDPGPFICMPKPVDFENLLHVFAREAR
jgi:CheY-like chemotaxis protein